MLGTEWIIAITLAAAAVAAAAQYLFKKSVRKFGMSIGDIAGMLMNRRVLAGLTMYLASLGIYLYALHAAPVISFVYPVFSSCLVFVLLISKYVLKERMSMPRVIGVIFIILGIAIISLTLT